MDSTPPDKTGHDRQTGMTLIDLLREMWRDTPWHEVIDLGIRLSRCETCEHKEWCDRHETLMTTLRESGPDAYWDRVAEFSREGDPDQAGRGGVG